MIALRLKRRLEVGVSVDEENEAYAKLDYLLDGMEKQLAGGPWIAGSAFTLADIAMAPMVNRIEVLTRPEMIAPVRRPSRTGDSASRHGPAIGPRSRSRIRNQGSSETIILVITRGRHENF